MTSRRASLRDELAKSQPYQIYTEAINTGKNLGATKKKVRWRFGWSNESGEHDIEFIHSLVSGKRTLLEDGREILSTSNILSLEFSHGWTSNGHIFRVEAETGVMSDPTYIFSIDGVRFQDFINQSDALRMRNSDSNPPQYVGRYDGSESTVASVPAPSRRSSVGATSSVSSSAPAPAPSARRSSVQVQDSVSQQGRSSFQSPTAGARTAADPFAGDPFATSPPPVTATMAVDLFRDPFQTSSSSSSSSDPFAPAPSAATKRTSVASTVFPTVGDSSAFDPFASAPAPAQNQAHAQAANPFSGSGSGFDPFGSTPAPAPSRQTEFDPFGNVAPNAGVFSRESSKQNLDNFAAGPMANHSVDPFTSQGHPVRRKSQIADLMGISFETSTSNSSDPFFQQPQQTGQQPASIVAEESSTTIDEKLDVHSGINSLVDLNLGGKKSDTGPASQQRRSSQQGPSLSSLMGNDQSQSKRPSMTMAAPPMSTFNTPAPPVDQIRRPSMNTMPPGPGFPMGMPPAGGMQGMPAMTGYGMMPPAPGQMPMMAPGVPMSQPGMQAYGSGFRPGSGSISTMMMSPNDGLASGYYNAANGAPKSSLDNLGGWK